MVWVILIAILDVAAAHNATKNNATNTEPPGWGSSEYHVHLKGCRSSQGVFTPPFESFYGGPYELVIDPTVEAVIINPVLNLRNYQPRFTPKITLDDKVVDYAPIRAIDVVVNFTGRLKGYDKTVELTIADPQAGYLTGNSMTYYIRLKKMANPAVTSLKSLKLLDATEKEIPPLTTHHANKYTFIVRHNMTELSLDFKCQDDSTEARINGHYFDASYPYPITMKDCETTLLVTCCYIDEEFTPNGEATRTYMVLIERNEHLADTVVELHTMSENGHCKQTDKTRWSCMSKSEDFNVIPAWNRSEATMTIINDKGVHTPMMRNLPNMVYLESGTHEYKMVLSAGSHKRTYHVSITQQGASNVVVLPDVPVLLDLWWGQGSCKKKDKGFSCIAKQEQINIVVHFAHSDKISAQLRTMDDKFLQDIHMGLPGGVITVRPHDVDHFVLKLWTRKDKIEYPIVVKPKVRPSDRKHRHKVVKTGPQTVAEENKANAEKKAREKAKTKNIKVLDFLAEHLYLT